MYAYDAVNDINCRNVLLDFPNSSDKHLDTD